MHKVLDLKRLAMLGMLAGVALGCRESTVLPAPFHSVRIRLRADGVLFLVQAHHGSVEKSTGDSLVVASGLLVVDRPLACEAESMPGRVHQREGTWTQVDTRMTVTSDDGTRHTFMLKDHETQGNPRLLHVSLGDEWKLTSLSQVILVDYRATPPSMVFGEAEPFAITQDQDWALVVDDLVDALGK